MSFIHSVISSLFFLQGSWNNTSVIFLPIFVVSLVFFLHLIFVTLSFLLGFCIGHAYPIFIKIFFVHLFVTAGAHILHYLILLILLVQREIIPVSCGFMSHRYLGNVGHLFDPELSCGDGV